MMKKFALAFLAWLGVATAAWADGGAALVSTTPTTPVTGQCAVFTGVNIIAGQTCNAGVGTVTSVTAGTGLTGGTITTTGTIAVNTGVIAALGNANTWTGTQTFSNAIVAPACTGSAAGIVPNGGTSSLYLRGDCTWHAPSGSGTVTSVAGGTGLTGGTITSTGTLAIDTSVIPTLAGGNTYTGSNAFTTTTQVTASTSTPTGTVTYLQLRPSDYGSGKPEWYVSKDPTASAWEMGTYDGVHSPSITGSLDIETASLTWNGTQLLTSGNTGIPTLSGTNVFTNFNTITAGSATCNCGFLSLRPNNYTTGHPALTISKDATANAWSLGLFDGTSSTGTITLGASQVTIPGNVTVTGALSVGSCSGCGGGGGGGYATVYDVAGSYGADPTGATSIATAFANALAACSATSGGTLWFRAGTFYIPSGGINDNVTGCNIKGSGPQSTNFVYHGTSGNAISINAYNVDAQDFAVLNAGSWTSGFGLAIGVSAGASLGLYNNLYFSGDPGFIYVTGSSETKITNIYGVNPTGAAAYQCDGAGASGVFGTRWDNVALGYGGSNTTTNGFAMGSGCNTWAIHHASVSGGSPSGNSCLTMASGASFLVVDDFECDHTNAGAQFAGGTGIQIGANSWFGSTLAGNGVTFGSSFSGFATITSAHIRDNLDCGVLINGSGGVTVSGGNIISGNASGQVCVGAGVSNFQINGNMLGVPGDPTSAFCAVVNTGASNYYTITGNVCGATNSAGVTDGGSGGKKSVSGNPGP